MKPVYHAMIAFGLLALLFGCASPPMQQWHSAPTIQTVSNQHFEVEIEPLKENTPYFNGFRLTLKNKTTEAVEIDWNATRCLHKGNDLDVFVFVGIDPETIKGTIPPDRIADGETFTKTIFPFRTIAFLPRSQRPEPGKRGFMAGILPAGNNSVTLALKQNSQQWQPTLSVRLIAETVQAKSKKDYPED